MHEWTEEKASRGTRRWLTDYPKNLQRLVALENVKSVAGWGAAKGYKCRNGKSFRIRSLLVLVPPATVTHSRRADGTSVTEFQSNMAILNRHGRMGLTAAHRPVGRKVQAFEGYSNQAEDCIYKFVRKQLEGLVQRVGETKIDPLLLRVRDPAFKPDLTAEDEDEVEMDEVEMEETSSAECEVQIFTAATGAAS